MASIYDFIKAMNPHRELMNKLNPDSELNRKLNSLRNTSYFGRKNEFVKAMNPHRDLMNKLNPNNELFSKLNLLRNSADFGRSDLLDKFSVSHLNQFKNPLSTELFSYSTDFKRKLQQIQEALKSAKNDPEYLFDEVADLNLLSLELDEALCASLEEEIDPEEYIKDTEQIIRNNITELLDKFEMKRLWQGANYACEVSREDNPDKVRHCLISLRTMIEHILEKLLAPDEIVREWDEFEILFIEYLKNRGIKNDESAKSVKVSRKIRIKYISSRFSFSWLEEFAKREIKFIDQCYRKLCSVHSYEFELTDSQLRILKIKADVIIWFLLHLHNMLVEDTITS